MISIARQYDVRLSMVAQSHRSAARKPVFSIRSRGTALCHHSVHAEQQAIIGMARIIDSVLVDDDRGDQSTELDQHMPVAAIAGETRGLDREHRADVSGADCADQTIKAGAGDAASRAAKVIIDDLDASPAELP